VEAALKEVAAIHGAAGVFAVAGYRMGERALRDLGTPRGSFALEVVHKTPMQVQYSCIADGLQAATGTSAGKLNLRIVEAPAAGLETIVRNRKTGQELIFHLEPDFLRRYLNLPNDQQPGAGRTVAALPESEIFTVEARAAAR
jgi:formylmethanofuran dehydrogenase subunit E